MRINNNIMALNAHRQLGINQGNGAKAMERLSSGLRINRAGDDAAGLAISEKMRAQVRGLKQASRNAQDGISLIQTAEGSLNESHAILQRMRELADQSANGTLTSEDRQALQGEFTELKKELDRIGNTTEFNTLKLLNGSLKSAGVSNVGMDVTSGAIIAKLEAAEATAEKDFDTDVTAAFVEETINIDGAEITVKWQNLTSEERAIINGADTTDAASMNRAVDLIVSTINSAIDESGHNVAHVSGYATGTGKLVLVSGLEGADSKIEATGAGIVGVLGGSGTAAGVAVGSSTVSAAITGAKVDLRVNGILMEANLSGVTAGKSLEEVATALQGDLNNAIGAYNNLTGKNDGEAGFLQNVTVEATKDGRLVIHSESGPVELADRAGTSVVRDLGLSQAQTESAGGGGMTFQIGANRGQTLSFGINDMRSAALGVSGVNISSQSSASVALDSLDKAISKVSQERSKLGAVQNRLEHTISNLNNSAENLQAAESRIRDLDMAEEIMAFTKNNILQQASTAMLAQANMAPQSVLQLLG